MYIVNSGGAVQQIRDADWTAIQTYPDGYNGNNQQPDARLAQPDEITAYWAAQGFTYDAATDTATPK